MHRKTKHINGKNDSFDWENLKAAEAKAPAAKAGQPWSAFFSGFFSAAVLLAIIIIVLIMNGSLNISIN